MNRELLAHVIVTDNAIQRTTRAYPNTPGAPATHLQLRAALILAAPQLAADHYAHAARLLRVKYGVTNRAADHLQRLAGQLHAWCLAHPNQLPAVGTTP